MSKTVKTIATVAAVAAAIVYTGGAAAAPVATGTGTATAATAGTTAGVGSFTAGVGGASTVGTSAFMAPAASAATAGTTLSTVGAGMSIASGGMQMLSASKAQDAAKEQERIQAKMQEAEAQKERIQLIRQQRVLAGRTEATAASRGFSPSGTSSIVTGLGSLNTQTAVASANITGKAEAARDLGSTQNEMYSAMNTAQGWQSFGSLGKDVFQNSKALSNIFKA